MCQSILSEIPNQNKNYNARVCIDVHKHRNHPTSKFRFFVWFISFAYFQRLCSSFLVAFRNCNYHHADLYVNKCSINVCGLEIELSRTTDFIFCNNNEIELDLWKKWCLAGKHTSFRRLLCKYVTEVFNFQPKKPDISAYNGINFVTKIWNQFDFQALDARFHFSFSNNQNTLFWRNCKKQNWFSLSPVASKSNH